MSEEHAHYFGVDNAGKHLSVEQARRILIDSIAPVKQEIVRIQESNTRVLSKNAISPKDLPDRARSSRDGYAVCISRDPISSFNIVGDVKIGIIPKLSVKIGEAARVATGSYLPKGANAVLMVEYARVSDKILVPSRAINVGENIVAKSDDFKRGETVLHRGARIHPQHVALFAMLGIRKVRVYSKPRIAFFSTGNELVDAIANKHARGIFDANRPYISAMISSLGGDPVDLGIARDNYADIKGKMVKGLNYDALLISAGSSLGERDYVANVAKSINGVRILIHGVAMRPSSPTGIATYKGKPLLMLPGFPTSTIVSFLVFAAPAVLKLGGCNIVEPPMIKTMLSEDYNGKAGLTHFVRVKLLRCNREYTASIVRPTEAQYSSWLKEANAVVVIGESGVARQGEIVDAFLIGDIPNSKG